MAFEFKPAKFPTDPGVYIMKGSEEGILYIGKAKNIRKRLASYFTKQKGLSHKTQVLVTRIESIETMVVGSGMEALVLENELIKKHRPPFNVVMRDDKNYLYVRITMQDEFPRITLARKVTRDGAKYFGPFVQSRYVYDTLRLIKKIFPLCGSNHEITSEKLNKRRTRACLNYHLGICPGVCIGKVSSPEYHRTMEGVVDFLGGKYEATLKGLQLEMQQLASTRKFEQAARLRDGLKAVQELSERQRIVSADLSLNQDVVGLARQLNKALVSVLQIRYGKLIGQQTMAIESRYEAEAEEIVSSFLRDYYTKVVDVPKIILLPIEIGSGDMYEKWLGTLAGHSVKLQSPTRGKGSQLLKLAEKNAAKHFAEMAAKWEIEKHGTEQGLVELMKILKLQQLNRIEAFDISNLQGQDSVGSMVVFEKGKMARDQYRRFKIKTVEGPNDFASLGEVLARRFARADEEDGFAKRPDLVVIDGGKGQVNTVAKAIAKFNVPLIGLSKGAPRIERAGVGARAASHGSQANDDIVLPNTSEPIVLPTNAPAKFLLQNIRDEAHRFAISYHHVLRAKRLRETELEKIAGVGPGTRKKLIKTFGSLRAIKELSVEQLADVVGEAKARAIKQTFDGGSPEPS